MVAARTNDVVAVIVPELRWHGGAIAAPVRKGLGNHHTVHASIGVDVDGIRTPVRQRMMGIQLLPVIALALAVIDIVAERLLLAAAQVRALLEEAFIGPIFVESQRLFDLHREDEKSGTLAACAPRTDNPIAELGRLPDPGLAGRERADAVKRIRRETEIAGHHIGVDFRKPIHQQLALEIGRIGSGTPSGFSQSVDLPSIAAMILSAFQGTTVSAYFFSASGTSHSLWPWAQMPTIRLPCFSAYSISQSTHSLSFVWGVTYMINVPAQRMRGAKISDLM